MRTIRISEEVWNAIAERGKFGETEDDVLKRVFNIISKKGPLQIDQKNTYSLRELLKKDLNKSIPQILYIGDKVIKIRTWAGVCINFVEWLINEGHLTKSKIPIFTYSLKNKYFINDTNEHANPNLDGDWRKVGDYFVDIKYNSINHVKNILASLDQLGISDSNLKLNVILK